MRLPVYEQQVRLAGRNRTDLSVRANPNAFGAQIGAAVQDLGGAVGKWAEAKAYKAALIDEAEAYRAINEKIDYDREVLYDPTSGALNQTGANGTGANRDKATSRIAERRQQIAESLSPGARKIFERKADALDDTAADSLIKHDAVQTANYLNAEGQALVDNLLTSALDNYGSDAKWDQFTSSAIGEAERLARLNGQPPEAIAKMRSDILGEAHRNRAIRIAYDDPIKADAYLDAHREEIGEAHYGELKKGMEPAVVDRKAEDAVDALRNDAGYIGGAAKKGGDDTWLVYNNKMAKRNLPISPALRTKMSFLRDMGVTMEVRSGGQKSAAELKKEGEGLGLSGAELTKYINDRRTGAENHDHGGAADVVFLRNGKPLDPNNPEDIPYLVEIAQRAWDAGVGGIGAGPGYMGGGAVIHIGGGSPRVWGSGGKGENAAQWLKDAVAGRAPGTVASDNDHTQGGVYTTRSAYEEIMKIEDPKVRAAALAKLDQQLTTEAKLSAEDQKNAGNEAWKMFLQDGMRPQDVPMDLQIKMGREGTLNFFESARAYESGTLVTNEEIYSDLQRMAVEDPNNFVALDLNNYRLDFSKSDFRAIEQLQLNTITALNRSETDGRKALDDPANMKALYAAAEQRYNDVVPESGAKKGTEAAKQEAARRNRYLEQMSEYSRQFMQEKGRLMTYDEQNRLFSMLLTPIILESDGTLYGTNQREAMLFDAPFREADERVARAGVAAEDISLVDEEIAREELVRFYGREPSDDEVVVHHNRKLLAQMGVSPEMTYADVPKDVRRKLEDRYPDASDEELVDIYIDFVLEQAKPQ